MSDVERAERNAKLDALSAKWKKREEQLEYAAAKRFRERGGLNWKLNKQLNNIISN